MKIWRVTYVDPNKGHVLKELYEPEDGLVTEAILLLQIKDGNIASATYLGEVRTK